MTRKTLGVETTGALSFLFGISQLVSQVDGGIPAYIMSTEEEPNVNVVRSALFGYVKSGFTWASIGAVMLFLLNKMFGVVNAEGILCVYILGTALSVFNILTSFFIKYKRLTGALLFIGLVCVVQITLLLIVNIYDFFSSSAVLLVVSYSLPMLICAAPHLRGGVLSSIDSRHSEKLQFSQIASSAIINKDYILMYLTSQNANAAVYAISGRLMYMPMQVVGLYLSRMWANLTISGATDRSLMINKVKSFMIFATAATLPFALWETKVNGLSPLVVIALGLLNVSNSASGVMSAFSALRPKSIPGVLWYFVSIACLYLVSVTLYFLDFWYLSIVATSIFFVCYSLKLFRNLKSLSK